MRSRSRPAEDFCPCPRAQGGRFSEGDAGAAVRWALWAGLGAAMGKIPGASRRLPRPPCTVK